MRPLANLGSTPGAVSSIRMSPGLIDLRLRDGLDSEMSDLRIIAIHFKEEEGMGERLRMVLQLMFEGTAVVSETFA